MIFENIEKRVQSIMVAFSRPWRWFCEGDWVVLEAPHGLIAAETMHHVHQHADVRTVEAVFRATPHPGIYLRFRLRDLPVASQAIPASNTQEGN